MVRGYKILIEMIEVTLAETKNMNAIDRIKLIGKTLYQFNIEFPNYFDAIINTAIVLWSCTIGLFNTLIKKRNYIEHYHNRSSEKLILEGLDMLIISIKNKNGGKKNE